MQTCRLLQAGQNTICTHLEINTLKRFTQDLGQWKQLNIICTLITLISLWVPGWLLWTNHCVSDLALVHVMYIEYMCMYICVCIYILLHMSFLLVCFAEFHLCMPLQIHTDLLWIWRTTALVLLCFIIIIIIHFLGLIAFYLL